MAVTWVILFALAAMLRCEPATIPDWREALLYGDRIGYADYEVDGRLRHTMTVIFRKRALLFVFKFERGPEPNAWHGCGMYELTYWT